jgi:serine phosphatase RsbU (regulator of sigma subunit)
VKDNADAIGKTDFDFFDHAREAYADELRIIETGNPLIDKQEKIRRADGEYRFVSATKVPTRNKDGVITGTVGITRDITERVKAEKELEEVKVRLEQAMAGIKEELDMARQTQLSLLPAGFPEMPGVKVSSAYLPCSTIGGDFYEVIKLDEHRLGVLMFDVVGHGVPAALVAAMAKMIFIENIARGVPPRELLSLANDKLHSHFQGKRTLAAFYGILESYSGNFVYAKGGHPPAIVVRSAGNRTERLSADGIFIGLFPGSTFEEKEVTLDKNDRLVMFTDGLIETFNASDQYFGLRKLEEALLETSTFPVDVMVSALLNKQKAFRNNTPHTDDITLLVLQRQ